MVPETSRAPAEWIARRTIWGSLGPVFAADEHTPVGSGGAGTTSPRAVPDVGAPVTQHLDGDSAGHCAALVLGLDRAPMVERPAKMPVALKVSRVLTPRGVLARLYLVADGAPDPGPIVGGRDAAQPQGVRWIWLIQTELEPGTSARIAARSPERQ